MLLSKQCMHIVQKAKCYQRCLIRNNNSISLHPNLAPRDNAFSSCTSSPSADLQVPSPHPQPLPFLHLSVCRSTLTAHLWMTFPLSQIAPACASSATPTTLLGGWNLGLLLPTSSALLCPSWGSRECTQPVLMLLWVGKCRSWLCHEVWCLSSF